MKRAALSIFIIFTLALIASVEAAHANNFNKKKEKENPKYASLVIDADSGQILSQRYANKSLHPASLTKMMTLLLTFEALDSGKIRKNSRIRISKHAASMPPSKLGLKVGDTIKVEHAIKALATKSANDIAVALGEKLAGSESRFASRMTARAKSIGMHKTKFKNASGLHNKYQVSTARDMAKLAQYILKRYPHHYKYFSTRSFTYRGKTYKNHNRLLDSYRGMDGFKTGYINAAGFNLVASAHRNGRRLIGVVFGGRSGKTRNAHMASILDKGFRKMGGMRTASTSLKTPPIPADKPTYGVARAHPDKITPPVKRVATRTRPIPPKQNAASNPAYASLASLSQKPATKITTGQQAALPKPKPVKNDPIKPNYTALTTALQNGRFSEITGEGDVDPSASRRLETGLIAVAVHKGEYRPDPRPATAVEKSLRAAGHAMVGKMGQNNKQAKKAENISAARTLHDNGQRALPHPKDVVGKWSIQIGAYKSRLKTDEALRIAKKKVPPHLGKVSAMTVPLQTDKGLIFRARLGGMSESQARNACQYFKDCITVAPLATRVSTR